MQHWHMNLMCLTLVIPALHFYTDSSLAEDCQSKREHVGREPCLLSMCEGLRSTCAGLSLFGCAMGNTWTGLLAETNPSSCFQTAPSSSQWVTLLMSSLDFMSRLESQTQPKQSQKEEWSWSFLMYELHYLHMATKDTISLLSQAWTQPNLFLSRILNKWLTHFLCFCVIHIWWMNPCSKFVSD